VENSLGRLLRSESSAGASALLTSFERPAVRRVAASLAAFRTVSTQPAGIVSAPSVQVSRPNVTIPPATGTLLGLLAGVGLALFAQERRERNRSRPKYRYPRPGWTWIAGAERDGR
jgi:hypothetical protein